MRLLLLFIVSLAYAQKLPDRSLWRTFDGFGNNQDNPQWGSANTPLRRRGSAVYADGISSSRQSVLGGDLPSPRLISNIVHSPPFANATQPRNIRGLTDILTYWGQFISHDMSLTGGPYGHAQPLEEVNIPIPPGDPFFGNSTMSISRSIFDPLSSTTVNNTNIPRQQINLITSFLDGSMVYGSDPVTASALREMSGGLLIVTMNDGLELPPLNAQNFSLDNKVVNRIDDAQLYLFGDVRGNENPALVSLHTIWIREHNRRARQLALENPN